MERTITVKELFSKVEALNKLMNDLHLYGQGRIPQLWVDGFFESEVKTYEGFKKCLEENFIEDVAQSFTGNLEIHDCMDYVSFNENYDDDDKITIEIRIY